MKKTGCIRVGSVDQNPAKQYKQFEEIGMDMISATR